ncbi:hypothetical protein Avbf_01128 [Armadillidium vulgare]|nr:hypothetical protein Avbf_01128 [Armadillidium vulgare]
MSSLFTYLRFLLPTLNDQSNSYSINKYTNVEQEVKKRLEEIRLLESRKSARLADQDTDFAKLADCTSERNSRKTSSTIDVPGCLANGSRKRRGSRPEDDLTDECAAALVLMKLSCSPRSPAMHERIWSWGSRLSSSKSPLEPRSVTPSPPLSDSSPPPPQVDDDLDEAFCEDALPRKRRFPNYRFCAVLCNLLNKKVKIKNDLVLK